MDKTLKAWGGFVDGKLHVVMTNDGDTSEFRTLQIFTNLREAEKQYEDVRRVEIRVID